MADELTIDIIDALPDDSPDDAFDLLEKYGLDTDGVQDAAEAKKRLRDHVKKNQTIMPSQRDSIKVHFDECNLTSDDVIEIKDLCNAKDLLAKHKIPTKEIYTVDKAKELLNKHVEEKNKFAEELLLSSMSFDKVGKVVQNVILDNSDGRKNLLKEAKNIEKYLKDIPDENMEYIKKQVPNLDQRLANISKQLKDDNCTIMIAGETGAGKSCLLNLLLGELSQELLSVSNLPSTSAMCEIKYGETPMLKAYPADEKAKVVEVALDRDTAQKTIAEYTSQKTDRNQLVYEKVEIYWPCEWIKDGITITDTPGVGESDELTELVKKYIPEAFGFIYVINTPNAGGINPEELEDLLLAHANKVNSENDGGNVKFDPRTAIFVCNKWDQVEAGQRNEIKEYVRKKLHSAWKDINFDSQVFFISTTKTIAELQHGHVSKDFGRLLLGIQNLLPVGFREKMEKQFWKMFHIMDRSTYVLKNYILCYDEDKNKDEKLKKYQAAEKKLKALEDEPEKFKRNMAKDLDTAIKEGLSRIQEHMKTPAVQDKLFSWKPDDCPYNDNLSRLQKLQEAYATRRIIQEIHAFEKENNVFENIQKGLSLKFKSQFLQIDGELAGIEMELKQKQEVDQLLSTYIPVANYSMLNTDMKPGKDDQYRSYKRTIFTPFTTIFKVVAKPFTRMKSTKDQKMLELYKKDKPAKMAEITKEVFRVLSEDKKMYDAVQDKLSVIMEHFEYLLQNIPQMIEANKQLLEKLKKECDKKPVNKRQLISLYEKGCRLLDKMNYIYMTKVRTFDLNLSTIKDMKKIGEGSFAVVYKGKLIENDAPVAVKRLKASLREDNVTDFLTEELNIKRLQDRNIIRFIGTSIKHVGDNIYPVLIMEYGSMTLDNIIYDLEKYQGPGIFRPSNPERPAAEKQAAVYAYEIASGLAAMHQLGFVHRDLKPENILVQEEDNKHVIKLCDLGISKRESDITKTKAGTPLYMAPEVLKEEKYDRTADMFSYGILLWEIWYGNRIETKYTIDNYTSFVKKPFNNYEPTTEWKDVMMACFDSNPKNRPQAGACARKFFQLADP